MQQDSPLNDIRIGKITADWAKARGILAVYQNQVSSTNDRAKEEAFKEEMMDQNLVLYISDQQTQGRGRNKNPWANSRSGGALLSSWSFYLGDIPLPVTSPRSGLALWKAATATWPYLHWSLKAPNDLYLGDKKAAGILLETLTQGADVRFIFGLGMNITSFPEEIETATSLLKNLPPEAPLLGEDYISFLDRFFFELTGVIEKSLEPLSTSETAALVHAMNLRPGKTEKYISLSPEGNIQTTERNIPWSSL